MIDVDEIFPPRPLWKFLSLRADQAPTWQQRLEQLLGGKAYLPSPNQFNDPFDCVPSVAFPENVEEFRDKSPRLMIRFRRALPEVKEEEFHLMFQDLLKWNKLHRLKDLAERSFSGSGARMGIFCLAECIESVLMWSHYANNHTGIALRFDFRKHQRGGLMPLFKVRYQAERPRLLRFFELEQDEDDDAALVDALRTKAEFWRYEQEWRLLEPDGAGTTKDFAPEVISGIVLGAKCTTDDETYIREAVRPRNLPIMRVRPDPITFDLKFYAA